MDAFTIAVAFARVDPWYFWYHMDFCELEAIVPAHRETWEQTRIIVAALTGEKMELPWDGEIAAAERRKLANEAAAAAANREKRIAAAAALSTMQPTTAQ